MLVNPKKLKTRHKNRFSKGMFEMRSTWKFNFHNFLEYHNVRFIDRPQSVGVCDNPEQILEHNPELLTSHDKFVIGLTKVTKKEHPNWRWNRWGKYIGKKYPTSEYLIDEKDIDEIIFYQIYEVL